MFPRRGEWLVVSRNDGGVAEGPGRRWCSEGILRSLGDWQMSREEDALAGPTMQLKENVMMRWTKHSAQGECDDALKRERTARWPRGGHGQSQHHEIQDYPWVRWRIPASSELTLGGRLHFSFLVYTLELQNFSPPAKAQGAYKQTSWYTKINGNHTFLSFRIQTKTKSEGGGPRGSRLQRNLDTPAPVSGHDQYVLQSAF